MRRSTTVLITAAVLFAAAPWAAMGAERAVLAEYWTSTT